MDYKLDDADKETKPDSLYLKQEKDGIYPKTHALKPDEISVLFERIEKGSEKERDYALQQLYHDVQISKQDPNSLNNFGIGLLQAGNLMNAMLIFEQLVHSFPENDTYRINLASTYKNMQIFEMCKYYLQHITDNSTNERACLLAQRELSILEIFLCKDEKTQHFRQLQIDSLNERIASGRGNLEDYLHLGKLSLQMQQRDPREYWLDKATSILEEGCDHYPNNLELKEVLAYCYSRKDDVKRLDVLLRTIEKISPNSSILQLCMNIDYSNAEFIAQGNINLAHHLLELVQSDDNQLKLSALQGLQRMVSTAPSNANYRIAYSFALWIVGENDEALKNIEKLVTDPICTHEFHFNIGQIFWLCGDQNRGRYHLELSLKYADSDQEREDAIDRIAELSRQK